MAGNVLCATDPNCASWIQANRDPGNVQEGEASGRRGGRRARVGADTAATGAAPA